MRFYLFIPPPPSSFPALRVRSHHREPESHFTVICYVEVRQEGSIFLQTKCRMLWRKKVEVRICMHTCICLRDTTDCRGQPVLPRWLWVLTLQGAMVAAGTKTFLLCGLWMCTERDNSECESWQRIFWNVNMTVCYHGTREGNIRGGCWRMTKFRDKTKCSFLHLAHMGIQRGEIVIEKIGNLMSNTGQFQRWWMWKDGRVSRHFEKELSWDSSAGGKQAESRERNKPKLKKGRYINSPKNKWMKQNLLPYTLASLRAWQGTLVIKTAKHWLLITTHQAACIGLRRTSSSEWLRQYVTIPDYINTQFKDSQMVQNTEQEQHDGVWGFIRIQTIWPSPLYPSANDWIVTVE